MASPTSVCITLLWVWGGVFLDCSFLGPRLSAGRNLHVHCTHAGAGSHSAVGSTSPRGARISLLLTGLNDQPLLMDNKICVQ